MSPRYDIFSVITDILFTLLVFPNILSENPTNDKARTFAVNSSTKIDTKADSQQNNGRVKLKGMRGISERIQQKLFESYSKADLPDLDNPTELQLGIYVNSFDSIHKTDMSYKLHVYLRQKWVDPRLKFNSETIKSWNDSVLSDLPYSSLPKAITFLPMYVNKMFLPDVFLR